MSKGGPDIQVAIAIDLLKSYEKIPRKQQARIREFIEKFEENPRASSINYEKIKQWKDPNLRSVRITQDYRGVVLKPKTGNVYLLLWVDTHDNAYDWAKDKEWKIHPQTGSLQVVRPEAEVSLRTTAPADSQEGLFAAYRDRQLGRLGIADEFMELVRAIDSDADLDAVSADLPQEAAEALYMLAAGYSYEDAVLQVTAPQSGEVVDVEDLATSLLHVDSRRRFHVVENAEELAEILNEPLALWRVFLHPSQRKLVERQFNGPARVLGGAGTGKTVVAMHRAAYLVRSNPAARILVTTFTRNLAEDIRQNLQKICSSEEMERIEVANLDAWVGSFLKRNGFEYWVAFDGDETKGFWENAVNVAPPGSDYDMSFYKTEWKQVIQAQAIRERADYFKASRVGRGVRLNRLERMKIWPVFEEYRAQLSAHKMKEFIDATREARLFLERTGDILPYTSIIVDEAQDFNPESFRLLRQMIPAARADTGNDLFIVGDAHQRIYGYKVVLSHCGIQIRGRGHKLKINYRTTEETRRWAVSLLENRVIDDLDEGRDDHQLYRSLLRGNPPQVRLFKTFAEEINFIKQYVAEHQAAGTPLENICLVARTNPLIDQYRGALLAAGIENYTIQYRSVDEANQAGLRLATMHRVKGLEFDHMIIAGANEGILPLDRKLQGQPDITMREAIDLQERALLYVAATRARKDALITGHGRLSSYLEAVVP